MKFRMYMGISGSGKTTIAYKQACANTKVFDSDEVRQLLFNDATYQGDNTKVFGYMQKSTYEALQLGYDVSYVATNLNSKRRCNFISNLRKKFPNIECECVVVVAPPSICKERNSARERHVPEFIIDNQLKQFQVPFRAEGWDSIEVVLNFKDFDGNEVWNLVRNFGSQKNPHHSLTLYDHLCATSYNIRNTIDLKNAARLHDIGKAYVQFVDEEGIAHYYGHEFVSAYLALCLGYNLYVAQLICYHMFPFSVDKEKLLKKFDDEKFVNDLLELHKADMEAK